jgi:NTP pyrophosphatase (non-canonical NTP hydrolase)
MEDIVEKPPICPKCHQPEVLAPGIDFYCPRCPVDWKEIGEHFKSSVIQHETQQSIHQWCKETFPRHVGVKGRAVALIEEAIELGLAGGLTIEEILAAVNTPIYKLAEATADTPMESDAGEVADVLLCLYAYAQEAGHDAHAELDKKMAVNRSRSKEYYAKKTAHKEDLGFLLPDAPPREG